MLGFRPRLATIYLLNSFIFEKNLSGFIKKQYATVGSNNPFPTKVAITLNMTAGKPRLTKPSRNPLVLGTILQGPVFMNLAIPNPPLKIERASVMGTDPKIHFFV